MPDYPDLPWSKINDYLMEITTARNIDQLLHEALLNIGNLVPFDHSGLLGFLDLPQQMPRQVIYQETLGGSQSCFQAFQKYYHRLMPDVGMTMIKVVVVDWYNYRSTEFVTDFILPYHARYSAVLTNFRQHRHGDLNLTIHRSNDLSPFTAAEIQMLQIVQGHLMNYCEMFSLANPDCQYPDAAEIRTVFPALTRREAEIAALLCRKYTAEMIASRLLISQLTVYKHIENIYAKLKINCRKDLRVKLLGLN